MGFNVHKRANDYDDYPECGEEQFKEVDNWPPPPPNSANAGLNKVKAILGTDVKKLGGHGTRADNLHVWWSAAIRGQEMDKK